MSNRKDAEKVINHLAMDFRKKNLSASSVTLKQYNYELSVIDGKDKVKVLTYFGKKGIKTILQGNESSEIYKRIQNFVSSQQPISFPELNSKIEKHSYIGTDESGKGDLFGPLVVAGFHFDKELETELRAAGVRDSKELTESKIISTAEFLIKNFRARISIVILKPTDYNVIYPKYNNLNKMLVELHGKVISNLSKKSGCREAIIDKFAKAQRFDTINPNSKLKIELHEKGERFAGVAAASIIARYNFIKWFAENKFGNVILPKGSSNETIRFAKKILEEYNPDDLKNFAKLHFKTFRR